MKHFFLLFTALVTTTALWAQFTVDGIYYKITDAENQTVGLAPNKHYSGSIIIPSSVSYNSTIYTVTSILRETFYYSMNLTSIIIPNSIISIDDISFSYCKSLTSLTIPNSVIRIGVSAFANCSSLATVTIGNSVNSIGGGAFANCDSLSSINVDDANTHYASEDGVLFNNTKEELIQYPSANKRTTYTIPNSVTKIDTCAIFCCSHLTSVTIPQSVNSMKMATFAYCTSLTSITCYATTPPTCEELCFELVNKSIPLYVPACSVEAYRNADKWEEFTNIQAMSTAIESIKDNRNGNRKVMIDGQMYIPWEGKAYNAQGVER